MAFRNHNELVQSPNAVPKFKKVVFSFVTPTHNVRASYASQRRSMTEALQSHRFFEDGLLLDTMEKGVLFPIVHFTELPDKKKPPLLFLDSNGSFDRDTRLQQGLYHEIRSFTPGAVSTPMTTDKSTPFKALIFMGFKTLDDTFSEVLEDNWKDWTGARLVYMNLSDEFGLSKLSFYRRVTPRDVDVFMYIMTVECESVNAGNKIKLLDFVQRLRVERMIGYLSVYKVFQKAPSTATVINGLLSEAVDATSDETTI